MLYNQACAAGNVEMVEFLIEEDREQLTKTTALGLTPLRAACKKGQVEMVKYLLFFDEVKEQIMRQDGGGSNVLHHAAVGGSLELFQFLFEECGSEAREHLAETRNTSRRTPTDEAIAKNHEVITRFAIKHNLPFNHEKIVEIEWLQKMLESNPPVAVAPLDCSRVRMGGAAECEGTPAVVVKKPDAAAVDAGGVMEHKDEH